MRYFTFFQGIAGLLGCSLAASALSVSAARAQSYPSDPPSSSHSAPCYIPSTEPDPYEPDPYEPDPYYPPYAAAPSSSSSYDSSSHHVYPEAYECDAVGPSTAALGSMLSSIGDSVINQQINFGGFANFVTPTGKLRHTSHDGLEIEGTGGARTAAFDIDEGSVFANASYDLPGTWFGGKIRVSGLAGYDRLQQDAVNGAFHTDIDAFIYGGSYLWTKGSFYSLSLIIGLSGEADGSAGGSAFDYDVSGYFTNSLYGYTFDLRDGWKFDTRVNIGHYDVDTDRFEVAGGGTFIKGVSESWNAGITGTLFTILEVEGGVMRPYILAAYKNVFDEDIDIKGDLTASFDQADNYGKVELGFDYVAGMVTYGAAAYTEFSADENTVGARLGVSVKLQ